MKKYNLNDADLLALIQRYNTFVKDFADIASVAITDFARKMVSLEFLVANTNQAKS